MLYATTPLNLAINKNAVSNLLRFCKVKRLQKGRREREKKRKTRVYKRLGEIEEKRRVACEKVKSKTKFIYTELQIIGLRKWVIFNWTTFLRSCGSPSESRV